MVAPPLILHNLRIINCLTRILTIISSKSTVINTQTDLNAIEIPHVTLDGPIPNELWTTHEVFILEHLDDDHLNTILEDFPGIRTKFIILGDSFTSETAHILFQNSILSVLFVDVGTLQVSTYFPYKRSKNTKDVDLNLSRLGDCHDVQDYFPDKNPKTWRNFTLILSFVDNFPYAMCGNCSRKGIETEIFLIICDFLQMKPRFVLLEDEDGLVQDRGDVEIGNILYAQTSEHFLYPYFCQHITIFVPTGHYIPRWKYILLALDWKTYLLFLLTSTLLTIFLVSISPKAKFFPTIYMIFLDQSVPTPRLLLKRRHLLSLVFILSTMMNIFYKCGFTHLFSNRFYQKGIESMEDLFKSDLKIGLTNLSLSYFNMSPDAALYLEDHLVICDLSRRCVDRVVSTKDLAILKPLMTVESLGLGRDLLQPIRPQFNLYHNTARVFGGSVLHELLDRFCQRMVEHGFFKKVVSSYSRANTTGVHKLPSKLRMWYLRVPLLGWLVGLVVGTLAFFVEYSMAMFK